MVSYRTIDLLIFAQQAEPRVPEPTRTFALMALLGIILLGLLLIAIAMLGASWARKQGFRRRSVVPQDQFLPREPNTAAKSARKTKEFSSAETFTGDDTVSGDDTVVT